MSSAGLPKYLTSEGYRNLVEEQVIKTPIIHRRYRSKPPVVDSGIKGDPCVKAWTAVLACYSANNFDEVRCAEPLETFHRCRAAEGTAADRKRALTRHRHVVRTLILQQKYAAMNPTGSKVRG
eukprot:TRINITY_DN1468_c0_g1_i3.p1 TRINITY_DN1468_c0_g1~~TRINITY_DN1468_c0_g1_i3.p1  ORF type:complete len:123 (+),score=2.93 TRINITY_DN1468_c0_g1_i3:115-483(+)